VNLNEYQELALRTHNEELSTPQALCNYALGACGEAGETADMIKKGVFHGHELNRHEIAKELGDQMWYIANLAKLIGFSLDDIGVMNVNKLKKRYPEGFNHVDSLKRVDVND
jgi:NTP pyrophosphatase (non-canonical NTP hydrolase)